jgi:hypothetical protein
LGAVEGADFPAQIQSVHPGHHHIGDQQRNGPAFKGLEDLGCARRDRDLVVQFRPVTRKGYLMRRRGGGGDRLRGERLFGDAYFCYEHCRL